MGGVGGCWKGVGEVGGEGRVVEGWVREGDVGVCGFWVGEGFWFGDWYE